MSRSDPILERWIAATIQSYPSPAVQFLSSNDDPFRNPVGHTLRQGLTALFEQLQGTMEAGRIESALDGIVRLRAVQDLTPSQAVGFVFLLKPLFRELAPDRDQVLLGKRIDQLVLMAFDKYMQCREQLADIRANERQRLVRMRVRTG